MTLRKYKRLLIVLALPLLAVGYIFSVMIWPYPPSIHIFCIQDDNCRNIGDGEFYKQTLAEYEPIASIYGLTEEKSYPRFYVNAAVLYLQHVEIIAARPYITETPLYSGMLAGRNATIGAGRGSGTISNISDTLLILACDPIWFESIANHFSAYCENDIWGGRIEFRTTDSSIQYMSNLRSEIQDEIAYWKFDYRIYQIVMIPIFLYVFLFGSLVAFAGSSAIRYVKDG